MAKLIKKIVKNCAECLYCDYNEYYSRSADSGWDCCNDDLQSSTNRIVDEWVENKYHKDVQAWEDSQKTLFPITERPKDPFTIPDWCPLEDINE